MKEKTIEQLQAEKNMLEEKLRKVQLQAEIDDLNRQIENYGRSRSTVTMDYRVSPKVRDDFPSLKDIEDYLNKHIWTTCDYRN